MEQSLVWGYKNRFYFYYLVTHLLNRVEEQGGNVPKEVQDAVSMHYMVICLFFVIKHALLLFFHMSV